MKCVCSCTARRHYICASVCIVHLFVWIMRQICLNMFKSVTEIQNDTKQISKTKPNQTANTAVYGKIHYNTKCIFGYWLCFVWLFCIVYMCRFCSLVWPVISYSFGSPIPIMYSLQTFYFNRSSTLSLYFSFSATFSRHLTLFLSQQNA